MYTIELKNTEGRLLATFDFPEDASEVSLSQFVDVEKAFEKKQIWLKENEQSNFTDLDFKLEYIKQVSDIVCKFTGSKDILKFSTGNYEEHILKFFGVKSADQIDFEQSEATLFTLYANIFEIIKSYKPRVFLPDEDILFTYKGEEYHINSTYRDALTNKVRFESLATAQIVEALEAWRLFEQHREKDEQGNYYFTTLLTLVACLSQKKGEVFPSRDDEIQRFINDRIIHFEQIDMCTALDVQSFFLNTTNHSKIIHSSLHFSIRRKEPPRTKKKRMHFPKWNPKTDRFLPGLGIGTSIRDFWN